MGRRRKPRTINEELLAQITQQAESEERSDEPRAGLRRLAVYVVVALVIVGLKEGIRFLPAWVGIVVGVLIVAHFVSIFVRSTRGGSAGRGRGLRTLFLVWLALCVVATVLVALGGFSGGGPRSARVHVAHARRDLGGLPAAQTRRHPMIRDVAAGRGGTGARPPV